jgi:HK97 family phage major capsid protein
LKVADLQERRAVLVAEMRAITTKPAGNGGDLSDEQNQRFDALKGDLEKVERSIERQRAIDDAERRMHGQQIAGNPDERFEESCRQFSLRAAIAGAAGLNVEWGRERELSAELQRRAGRPFQGVAVPLSVFHQRIERGQLEERVLTAGTTVGTDLLGGQFIDRLRAALVVRRLGATVLTGLVGNVDIPRLTTSATTGWVAENAAVGISDPVFDKVSLTPKHVGARTEFSRNMLLQSSPDVEQLLRNDFARVLAQVVDEAAIEGGGTNEPVGILATAGIGDVALGTNGAAPTWDAVLSLIKEVEIDNAEGRAFLTNPKAVKKMRASVRVASTDSRMIQEEPNVLAGYPLASTNLVPSDLVKGTSGAVCSALIFGNFSDLILGYWSELDVLVNPYESTSFSKGNIQIRGMITMDVDVRHAESFAAIKDMLTT